MSESKDFSITEIKNYLRCRRMWDFTSLNRKGLTSCSPMPNMNLWVGTVFHKILEDQVFFGEKPDVDKIINSAKSELEENYIKIVGSGLASSEWEYIQESIDLIKYLAEGYFEFYGDTNPLDPLKYDCAEVTFSVPIPMSKHNFVGTIDGIARDEKNNYWLVEHKTVGKTFPSLEELSVNYQMLAYSWAFYKLTGTYAKGVLYDGVLKKQYKRKAVVPSDLFMRHKVIFSKKAITNFEAELFRVTSEMSTQSTYILPNFLWSGCFDCGVRDLCTATQLAEDVQFLMKNRYRKNDGWRTNKVAPITSLKLEEKK